MYEGHDSIIPDCHRCSVFAGSTIVIGTCVAVYIVSPKKSKNPTKCVQTLKVSLCM
jgi:hypothetical protein